MVLAEMLLCSSFTLAQHLRRGRETMDPSRVREGIKCRSIGRAASMKKAREDAQAESEAFRAKEEEKFLEASKKVRLLPSVYDNTCVV